MFTPIDLLILIVLAAVLYVVVVGWWEAGKVIVTFLLVREIARLDRKAEARRVAR